MANSNHTQSMNEDSESQIGYKTCLRMSPYGTAQGFGSRAASYESSCSAAR